MYTRSAEMLQTTRTPGTKEKERRCDVNNNMQFASFAEAHAQNDPLRKPRVLSQALA